MVAGMAAGSTTMTRRQSIRCRNTVIRLALLSKADNESIGTTGSGPTIGTSTSGINAPVPYPDTPPTTEATSAMPAMSRSWSSEMPVRPDARISSMPIRQAWACRPTLPRSRRGHQIGRRDQYPEGLTPDDNARIVLEIDARGDRIALTALEGAQAAEIDEHLLLEVRVGTDRRLRHEIDMECRPRPDFKIALQEDRALVDADFALAVMHRIGRIGMNEGADGDQGRAVGFGQHVCRW